MKRINEITYTEIGRLDPLQLVKLLRILLHAEARQRGILKAGIHVPLNIVVPDGGEDGRWDADLEPSDYIPNRFTVYQCKAEDIGITECGEEILKEQNEEDSKNQRIELKTKVREALEKGGSYCFFCKTHYVQDSIDKRLAKVKEALKAAGRPDAEHARISFLDGNKIAAWTNLHAGAISFVLEACNLARTDSFLTWEAWGKHRKDFRFPFETNTYLDEHIKSVRNELVEPKAVARIVGQSGLGKTRLAFEIFRPLKLLSGQSQTALTDSTVYFDLETAKNGYYEVVRQLAEDGIAGIVVVDNCPRREHEKLSQLATMDGSNISLLTLDYEPERIEAAFLHVLLEPGKLEDIIPRLLSHIDAAKRLTDAQREHIARYCQGFPQIAVLLAESEAPFIFEHLTESAFAEKLLWGRGDKDENALRAVKSLSLFKHVGAFGKVAKQLAFVSRTFCPSFDERTYREKCARFVKLRVIQTAGDYWFVSPKPLAVALAAKWWESATTTELMSFLSGIESNGLVEAFCSQLRLLDSSENAKKIVQDLCANNGPFGSAEVVFSKLGSRLFRSIVELNPTSALVALKHAFDSKGSQELRELTESRRNLVWSLEKLCWDAELFPSAAQLLLRLAAAEVEFISNNATGQFVQLFQLVLSGTQQPALKRLDVVEIGLSRSFEEQKVCIAALGMALHPVEGHFSRMGGVETRGANLPQTDWAPKTNKDITDYQLKAFALLKDIIFKGGEISGIAAAELGKRLRTLLTTFYLDRLESDLQHIAKSLNNYWPEARASVESQLAYKELAPAARIDPRGEKLLEVLRPSDLRLRVQEMVTNPKSRVKFTESNQVIDLAARDAENLGRSVAADSNQLAKVLPDVQSGRQGQGFAFGVGLANGHPNPDELVNSCLAVLRLVEDPDPFVLGGILHTLVGQPIIYKTLESVANDAKLRTFFMRLVTLKKLTRADLEWIVRLVREGKIQAEEIKTLCFGSVTDSLSPEELRATVIPMTRDLPQTVVPVYEVYAMYTFQNAERWEKCKADIRELILQPKFFQSLVGSMHAHLWAEQCVKFLKEPDGEEFARNQMQQIVDAQFVQHIRYGPESPEPYRVASSILSKFADTIWPIVGEALLHDDAYMLSDLLGAHPDYSPPKQGDVEIESFSCVLWSVPTAVLINWCKAHPDSAGKLMEFIGLFTTNEDGSFEWHPTALALLEEFYRDDFKSMILSHLSSFGSTGSRVPYVERRIELLEQLKSNAKAHVRDMANELRGYLESQKGAERKHDEEFSAGIPWSP